MKPGTVLAPREWYRVRNGFTFPYSRERNIFYRGGDEFQATDVEIAGYEHMLDKISDRKCRSPVPRELENQVPEPPLVVPPVTVAEEPEKPKGERPRRAPRRRVPKYAQKPGGTYTQ